jgi:hypothetical protein
VRLRSVLACVVFLPLEGELSVMISHTGAETKTGSQSTTEKVTASRRGERGNVP